MVTPLVWFERQFTFGLPARMLPFYLLRLEGTIARMHALTHNIPDDILSQRPEGKWSVKQNIGHLAEVDEVSNQRIDQMKAGIATLLPAVFEPQDYTNWPIHKLLEHFARIRTENIRKYESMAEIDLMKSSLHPRLKVQITPVDLAWFDAEHDDHHLLKVKEITLNTR
jgi:hypothetical protein